jgi:hypothetical protein
MENGYNKNISSKNKIHVLRGELKMKVVMEPIEMIAWFYWVEWWRGYFLKYL